jgi:predicted GNAT family N-acyltransferase
MKEKHITIKTANTKSELEECFRLREEVFIIEQSVPVDMERDEHDATALHFLALIDAKPVGTARVVLKDNGTVAKIGRVAVRRSTRGIGIGKRLIAAIEETPALEGVDHFILEAQTHALQFYARMGYQAYGEEFMDAGIPHFRMKKRNPSRAEFKQTVWKVASIGFLCGLRRARI